MSKPVLHGMDAVIAKSEGKMEKRKAAVKRKPGLAIMVAVGKAKPEAPEDKKGKAMENRAVNRALAKTQGVPDGERVMQELDDLHERVSELEKIVEKLSGHKATSGAHHAHYPVMGGDDVEEEEELPNG
jgi:hypothetical protein